ncbi:60S ribosomal protein L12 [Artemisia annua]|uniref:60S ribosomal protein L12 n=1 Tax=Artemisia annua TaxID=35608 RepID=A0A2U1PSZ4_ARTAN|nr:60S ribosomal protein L12 [Artemisia annua]
MPPKFDPSQAVEVYIRVTGGDQAVDASSLAPNIRKLGLSLKKINQDIAKELTAKNYKGISVTVKLTLQNHQVKVSVVPPGAALVIKALKELERDGQKVNNISLDAVFEIARVVQTRTMTKDYKRVVKIILSTCHSLGCTVDGKIPIYGSFYI